MNFGGPVWHASVSGRYSRDWRVLEEIARDELTRVGDASLGEWTERGDVAFHLRRRLTDKELREAQIDGVVDVRGTPEQVARVDRLRPFLPPSVAAWPADRFP